jgi:hypothetical protein
VDYASKKVKDLIVLVNERGLSPFVDGKVNGKKLLKAGLIAILQQDNMVPSESKTSATVTAPKTSEKVEEGSKRSEGKDAAPATPMTASKSNKGNDDNHWEPSLMGPG